MKTIPYLSHEKQKNRKQIIHFLFKSKCISLTSVFPQFPLAYQF